MKRVYVNEQWCLGCHLCEYYCAFAETKQKDMARALKGMDIRPRIRVEEHEGISFAVSCRHCEEPLCTKGCITGALTRVDDRVVIDRDRCVGCYTCVLCCPYGALSQSDGGAMNKCELCVQTHEGVPQWRTGMPQRRHCIRGEVAPCDM